MRCDPTCQSMVELLASQAADQPDGIAYMCSWTIAMASSQITFGELDRRARLIAATIAIWNSSKATGPCSLPGWPRVHLGLLRMHVR